MSLRILNTHDLFPYWAGFFDGEGYVGLKISDEGRGFHCRLRCAVYQNQPDVLISLQKAFGGSISKNKKGLHSLEFMSYKAEKFLKTIEPWVYVKREEVRLALEGWELKKKYKGGVGRAIPKDIKRKLIEYKSKISELNQGD